MSNLPLFTADQHGYYYNGCPFIPLIQEYPFPLKDWSNVVSLRLPAGLDDDLSWEQEKEQSLHVAASGKHFLWELDLGLSSFKFTPEK